jgi:hypothetical protein
MKYLNSFNGCIFLILLIINIWIYVNRNEGYAYQEISTYNQLYQYEEMTRISDFYLKGKDSLKLEIHSKELKTKKSNDNCYYDRTIKIDEGKKKYIIQSSDGEKNDSIVIGINLTSEQTYAQSGRKRDSNIALFYSNTAIGKYELYPLHHWKQYSQYTTSEEIIIVNQILLDSIKIHENDNSIIRIEKIASYVLKELDSYRGIPIDSMDIISPLEQFEFVKSKKSKVWCGNFSQIFSFLANNAGVLTRAVDVGGNIEGVVKPEPMHSFSEVFIKELNKWVFIDLTSKTLFVKSSSGELLNTIEFYHSHMLKNNLTIITFEQDSIIQIDYESIRPFYDHLFRQDSYFLFYFKTQFTSSFYDFSSKVKRYLTKSPTYAAYSNSKTSDNKKFYIKQFFIYTLLSFMLYSLMCAILVYNYKKTLHNKK